MPRSGVGIPRPHAFLPVLAPPQAVTIQRRVFSFRVARSVHGPGEWEPFVVEKFV